MTKRFTYLETHKSSMIQDTKLRSRYNFSFSLKEKITVQSVCDVLNKQDTRIQQLENEYDKAITENNNLIKRIHELEEMVTDE